MYLWVIFPPVCCSLVGFCLLVCWLVGRGRCVSCVGCVGYVGYVGEDGSEGVTRDRETGRHTQTHRQRARALGVCEKKEGKKKTETSG